MEKKDRYVAKLHQTIDSLSSRVDRAESKVKGLQADAKQRYEQTIATLKSRLNDLKSRARELEQTGEDTWDALRKSVEVGLEEFKKEYQTARHERNLEELEALPAWDDSEAEKPE